VIVTLAAICYPIASAAPNAIHPDLAFNFICSDRGRDSLDDKLERWLRQSQFNVLNLAQVRREHGVPSFQETDIIGLDQRRRRITVTSFPPIQGRYSLALYTPPPTQRQLELEHSAVQFVSDTLNCEVSNITRGENGAEAAAFYDMIIKQMEQLFMQAERLRGERRL
jgi:hypothetical protein